MLLTLLIGSFCQINFPVALGLSTVLPGILQIYHAKSVIGRFYSFDWIEIVYGLLITLAELGVVFSVKYLTDRKKSNYKDETLLLDAQNVSCKYGKR
jgi:hypothetical protein